MNYEKKFSLLLWHINRCRLSNTKSCLYIYTKYKWFISILLITLFIHLHTVKWFQVLLCITSNLIKHQSFVCTQFKCQFYLTLLGATTPVQSGSRSNDNEGVLHLPQSSSITGASPSDCLALYPEHSLRRGSSYSSSEMHSVYSTAPANWAKQIWVFLSLLLRIHNLRILT